MAYSEEQLAAMVRGDSVHRGVYTDPAIFDMEMERIYGRAWIYVGHESQVPRTGDYHTTRLGDQDVLMVRAADGRVRTTAVRTRAPRWWRTARAARASSSAARTMPGPSLDGSHLGVPLKQGLEGTSYDPADPTFSMRRLARVDSYRGFVFASQSAEGPALEDFLGGVRSSIDNLRPLAGGRGGGGRRRVPRDAALELEGVLREPARHHARPRHARVLVRRRARRSQGNRRDAVRAAHHGRQRRALRILGKAGTARLPERPRLYGRHLQPRRGRARSDFAGALRDAGGGLWRGQGAPGAGHEPAQHRDLRQRLAPYRVPAVPRDPAGGRGPHADRDPDLPLQGARRTACSSAPCCTPT